MNAFDILGATPEDTNEQLRELLDEKLLLTDDEDKLQNAYFELSNPKKRIRQEVLYFSDMDLTSFNQITLRQLDENPTIITVANTFVKTGLWFESGNNDLMRKINEARKISGYTQIEETNIVSAEVEALKKNIISSAISYFDELKQNSVVEIFNAIVKIKNYESFFIDELIAYYENRMSEIICKNQDECVNAFNIMEKSCRQVIDGNPLPLSAKNEYEIFKETLLKLDKILQPLQVNAQIHGASHKISETLVHDLRNKIIELCNDAQQIMVKILQDMEYSTANGLIKASMNRQISSDDVLEMINRGRTAKEKLPQAVVENISLIEHLIPVLRLLADVFAESTQFSEMLKKDIDDFTKLYHSLIEIRKKTDINTYNEYKKEKLKNPVMDKSYHVFTVEQEDKKRKRNKMIFGIYNGVIAFILMIIFIVTIAIGTAEGFWIVFTIGIFIAYIIGLLINFYASGFETSSKIGFSILMTFFTLLMSVGLFTG